MFWLYNEQKVIIIKYYDLNTLQITIILHMICNCRYILTLTEEYAPPTFSSTDLNTEELLQ